MLARVTCVVVLCWTAVGGEPFPAGLSSQERDGRRYEILMPADFDPARSYSLLVAISDGRDIAGAFSSLAAEGYIVCAPKPKAPPSWATSEAKEVHALVDELVKELPIAPDRLHAVGIDDWQGFFPHVAFRTRGKHVVASVTFVQCAYRGGSPAAAARKRTGVLILGDDPKIDEERLAESLASDVRSIEYRAGGSIAEPYFAYWAGVMEGRFKPGHDLSFPWMADWQEALKTMAASGKGAFVYFFSAEDDKDDPDAKTLQNEVFLAQIVRVSAAPLVPVKLERERNAELFGRLGVTKTPAVVVVDAEGRALKKMEGRIAAVELAKALREAGRSRGGG